MLVPIPELRRSGRSRVLGVCMVFPETDHVNIVMPVCRIMWVYGFVTYSCTISGCRCFGPGTRHAMFGFGAIRLLNSQGFCIQGTSVFLKGARF